jgi:hypothetical protein
MEYAMIATMGTTQQALNAIWKAVAWKWRKGYPKQSTTKKC